VVAGRNQSSADILIARRLMAGREQIEVAVVRIDEADWRCRMTADCPRRGSYSDLCGAHCPDLPKVF
jgi:hypothetical protein